jgi:hypothetical protein
MGLREGKGFRTERPSEPTRVTSDCLWGQSVGWLDRRHSDLVCNLRSADEAQQAILANTRVRGWLQRNAAAECNIMPPVAASPMHYYPAARCNPILPFNAKGLDCQIQRPAPAWRTPVGQPGSKAGFARYPPGFHQVRCPPHAGPSRSAITLFRQTPPRRARSKTRGYGRTRPRIATDLGSHPSTGSRIGTRKLLARR